MKTQGLRALMRSLSTIMILFSITSPKSEGSLSLPSNECMEALTSPAVLFGILRDERLLIEVQKDASDARIDSMEGFPPNEKLALKLLFMTEEGKAALAESRFQSTIVDFYETVLDGSVDYAIFPYLFAFKTFGISALGIIPLALNNANDSILTAMAALAIPPSAAVFIYQNFQIDSRFSINPTFQSFLEDSLQAMSSETLTALHERLSNKNTLRRNRLKSFFLRRTTSRALKEMSRLLAERANAP